MIEYRCPYCYQWQPKKDLRQHMMEHSSSGDDVDTIRCAFKWEDFQRRFSSVGLYEVRGVPDEYGN